MEALTSGRAETAQMEVGVVEAVMQDLLLVWTQTQVLVGMGARVLMVKQVTEARGHQGFLKQR